MTPRHARATGYNEATVKRVRRTLDAVAASVDHEADARPGPLDRPRLAPGPSGRARWWLGASAVGVAAAGLVAFVVVAGRTDGGDEVAPADERGGAGRAAPTVAGPPNTDVVLPGSVPEGFSLNGFRVLDPLEGSIEVEAYADGDDTVIAFVTDVPATADRLAERTELWGDEIVVSGPTQARSDGYLGFSREPGAAPLAKDVADALARLATGVAADEAAPDGYDLAASLTTVALPEAGRMVAVDYLGGSSSVRLATWQGTLDAELAPYLYPEAEAVEIRGHDGFRADDGRLLVWQEDDGLVVSALTTGPDPAAVDGFVDDLEVVSEDDWVTLRESASILDRGEIDTPARPVDDGSVGGVGYRLEAFARGSLSGGVTGCLRLSVDGPGPRPTPTACDDLAAPVTVPVADLTVVWSETDDGPILEAVDAEGEVVDRVTLTAP
ncbi:MAG: hypothetical protein ACRD0A_02190 [Acidimicrobiales bacterium]